MVMTVMMVMMVVMEDELDELSGLLAFGANFRFACTTVAYGVVGSLDRLLLALGAVHRCKQEEVTVRKGVGWSFVQRSLAEQATSGSGSGTSAWVW
jgi:hypothetical protein